ncbi:hypothetical protein [Variovorax sp. GT1P44]|uniref:hypothetical protein n=1 Tax=Variovorax sp. GT1P44 TaxID=3443742 RepID=UPI003F46EA67
MMDFFWRHLRSQGASLSNGGFALLSKSEASRSFNKMMRSVVNPVRPSLILSHDPLALRASCGIEGYFRDRIDNISSKLSLRESAEFSSSATMEKHLLNYGRNPTAMDPQGTVQRMLERMSVGHTKCLEERGKLGDKYEVSVRDVLLKATENKKSARQHLGCKRIHTIAIFKLLLERYRERAEHEAATPRMSVAGRPLSRSSLEFEPESPATLAVTDSLVLDFQTRLHEAEWILFRWEQRIKHEQKPQVLADALLRLTSLTVIYRSAGSLLDIEYWSRTAATPPPWDSYGRERNHASGVRLAALREIQRQPPAPPSVFARASVPLLNDLQRSAVVDSLGQSPELEPP